MKEMTAEEIIKGAEALERAMKQPPGSVCICILSELVKDFSLSEINTIIKYQARICALLALMRIGGDFHANNHLVHLLERREQLESTDIFNDEILEK